MTGPILAWHSSQKRFKIPWLAPGFRITLLPKTNHNLPPLPPPPPPPPDQMRQLKSTIWSAGTQYFGEIPSACPCSGMITPATVHSYPVVRLSTQQLFNLILFWHDDIRNPPFVFFTDIFNYIFYIYLYMYNVLELQLQQLN
jgi:hypothetical protein